MNTVWKSSDDSKSSSVCFKKVAMASVIVGMKVDLSLMWIYLVIGGWPGRAEGPSRIFALKIGPYIDPCYLQSEIIADRLVQALQRLLDGRRRRIIRIPQSNLHLQWAEIVSYILYSWTVGLTAIQ